MRSNRWMSGTLVAAAAVLLTTSGAFAQDGNVCLRNNLSLDCCNDSSQGDGTSGNCDGSSSSWVPVFDGFASQWSATFDDTAGDNIDLSSGNLTLSGAYCTDTSIVVELVGQPGDVVVATWTLPANAGPGCSVGGNCPTGGAAPTPGCATLNQLPDSAPTDAGAGLTQLDVRAQLSAAGTVTSGIYTTDQASPTGVAAFIIGQATLLPVSVTDVRVDTVDGVNTVVWETASEQNNLGFHVFRGSEDMEQIDRLNSDLVAGAGTSAETHTYRFADTTARPGGRYIYYVQSVSSDGRMERVGEMVATFE